MNVKVISKTDKKLVFVLDGATPAFSNALRRIMISEVPVLAIDDVEMHDNNSVLFDEIIAHRLGLVPLLFDPKKFNFLEECTCKGKGCSSCEAVFALEKTGPAIVYSGDLKSADKEVKPLDATFIIAELLNDQNLKLEAIARLGKGVQHAKWQAANATYSYYPELEITNQEKAEKFVKKAAEGLYTIKGGKIAITDLTKLEVYKKHEEECDGIKVVADDTKFVFSVESISGLKPEYIVSESAKILGEKAAEFKKQLAELK